MRKTINTLENNDGIRKLKGMYKIKEYIFIKDKEVFRVYGESRDEALHMFKETCRVYGESKREKYNKYWGSLLEASEKGEIEIIESTDFIGVRRIK